MKRRAEAEDNFIYRNEMKYLCSEQELRLIENRIRPLCRRDPHVGQDGIYTVRSVYFDDFQDSCYYENEDGVNFREKFRIRMYNGDKEYLALECKQKQNGMNCKFSCRITEEQCRAILQGDFSVGENADPLLEKFFVLYRARLYRPKVIVEYQRTPFLYEIGNVRITFDRNIAAAARVQDFMQERIFGCAVMPTGMQLLEVKYDGLLPDYLYHALQIGNLNRTAYSKYYVCRTFIRNY